MPLADSSLYRLTIGDFKGTPTVQAGAGTNLDWRDPICEAFIEGAVQLGIPRNRDYNGTMQAGVSYVQRIIQNGVRKSAARGYLHPAMKRKNLSVEVRALVAHITMQGKRATGVEYEKGGQVLRAVAERDRLGDVVGDGTDQGAAVHVLGEPRQMLADADLRRARGD